MKYRKRYNFTFIRLKMSQEIRRHDGFLKFLYFSQTLQKRQIIDIASNEQLNAFREIALNLYMGQPPISGYYKTKLKVFKNLLQLLSDRRVKNTRIKKLLRSQIEVIPLILKPYFKEYGRGISTREKNDLRPDENQTK